jgi:hypothetical protein
MPTTLQICLILVKNISGVIKMPYSKSKFYSGVFYNILYEKDLP